MQLQDRMTLWIDEVRPLWTRPESSRTSSLARTRVSPARMSRSGERTSGRLSWGASCRPWSSRPQAPSGIRIGAARSRCVATAAEPDPGSRRRRG